MPKSPPAAIRRRVFLAGAVAGLGAAGGIVRAGFTERADGRMAAEEPFAAGTTLMAVAARPAGPGYRRLAYGPGWPRTVRHDIASPRPGRADRRTPLAAFVQFTDLHLTDVQHPLRYEFFRSGSPAAWRPQEALTLPGAVSLIERVNGLGRGPATGAPLSFVMATGDNTDNNAAIELDWFLTAMNGGTCTPDTGDPGHYEGVQNSGLELFWHPESLVRDLDTLAGFPKLDGFLTAAVKPVRSPGLAIPWYSTLGNHDGLSGGCYAATHNAIAAAATGDRKLQTIPPDEARSLMIGEGRGTDPAGHRIEALLGRGLKTRTVTPDPRRAPFTMREYLAAHLDPDHVGPGPAGHGYTAVNLSEETLYYSFPVADGVIGISLDSTDPGGGKDGSIGSGQLRWLGETLTRHKDQYALVFSHHPSWSMDNGTPDPARPAETRHSGDELIGLLGSHRNVLAWINGHSHCNRIRPRRTFWEICTASHIDSPQLARVIEVADNHDGTLSLFTTLIESAAPPRSYLHDLSQTGLASLYRELAANAQGAAPGLAGTPTDRNTELLLATP
ncbi:TIGR03767 family metallophosphoesterase [Streptomyces sp. NPDC046261]|uniref:TIGR03767 family metallophosphoesterase n=1 Tax=Streptomyces sp. NPDC046261 TaxID=3157200 RepID=UPI0033E5AABF